MTDDCTPTMNEIRADYVRDHSRNFDSFTVGRSLTSEQEFYGDQFDRTLAAHVAEKRAEWEAEQGEAESAEQARAHALHDAFWAVHVGRFGARNGTHTIDTFYAGTNAAKRAIENLHGAPIIRPWLPVPDTTNTESEAE